MSWRGWCLECADGRQGMTDHLSLTDRSAYARTVRLRALVRTTAGRLGWRAWVEPALPPGRWSAHNLQSYWTSAGLNYSDERAFEAAVEHVKRWMDIYMGRGR